MISIGRQAKLNILTGWVAIAILAVFLAGNAGWFAMSEADVEGRKFIAYVDNGGGLTVGNKVWMDGQPIGRIVETNIVNDDGKVRVQLVIEIFPIDDPDDNDKEIIIPRDTKFIVQRAGAIGDPLVLLVAGSEDYSLDGGEKFKDTTSPKTISIVAEYGDKARGMRDSVDGFVSKLEDDDTARKIAEKLASIREEIAVIDSKMGSFTEFVDAVKTTVPDASQSIQSLRTQLSEQSEGIDSQLAALEQSSGESADGVQSLSESLVEFQTTLDKWTDVAEKTRQTANESDLRKMLRDLRWQSAELAAMGETIKNDPSNTSGGESRRAKARKFNAEDGPLGRFGGKTRIRDTE